MIYLGDTEIGIVIGGGGEPNFAPYRVTYSLLEDGTYEMQINNYTEQGSGEKVFIGTLANDDETQNLYLMEEL